MALPVLLVAIARATGGMVRTLLLSVFSWAWRAALFAAVAVAASRLWTPHSPLAIGAAGLVAALAYALVMLPLVLSEPLAAYTRRALPPQTIAGASGMSRRRKAERVMDALAMRASWLKRGPRASARLETRASL